jgi:hypothetical protein
VVITQAGGRKNRRSFQAGFVPQLLERGQGKAISTVQLVEFVKKLGFELSVKTRREGCAEGLERIAL